MPRRNIAILVVIIVISLACGLKANRYSGVLGYAMQQISERYFEDVDQQVLFEGAMDGMVRRLDSEFDDNHSAYIRPSKVQGFEEMLSQEFGGVGMEVRQDPETQQLTVVMPLPGSPAAEAGILAGDRIMQINGQTTKGLSLTDAVKLMHGETGTSVKLAVLHKGEADTVEIEIVRAVIQIDTVVGHDRNADGSWQFFLDGHDKIAYVRIRSFADNTAEEMQEVMQQLVDDGICGMVLDLRSDPGGYLDQAVKVCDMFINSGVIVSTRRRHDQIFRVFTAKEEGTLGDFPVAVLVNQYSASASEIVAACLQDHKRAVVVGERTFGKGTIQEIIGLESQRGMLKLTTGTYWRPSEKDINRRKGDDENDDWGVRPNEGYEVAFPEKPEGTGEGKEDSKEAGPKAGADFVDPQLEKAKEYLQSKLKD